MAQMTETEVKVLADQVGEVDMTDPVVQAMLKQTIVELEIGLKRDRATFRLFQLLRDDDKMKAIAGQIEGNKKILEAIKGFLVVEVTPDAGTDRPGW